jgi:two-component system, cell cycle sensor histidine kinase DivJ
VTTALEQAQQQLTELIEAARKGAIIPVRLTGQLEALQTLLTQAGDEAAKAAAEVKPPADQAEFLREQAYFVSHAIHELRTPMTSIRGYADMLVSMGSGSGLNDMQKGFLDTIRGNARRMEGLLTDVSDMAKIRSGVLKITEKMDMFKNIAMMVEKTMRPLAEQLGKTLTLDIPQGLPILNTDGELLAKAITKLVENGLRYSGENGEVTVRGASQNGKLVVNVSDNGIGMAPEELAQLGTIYFRSENELVRSFKGSGLGVPVAYGIVRVLGGTISVESAPDKGTTFTITLSGMS